VLAWSTELPIFAWVPIVAVRRRTTGTAAPSAAPNWDSRECPGPNSEAALSRPSTGRVLAAGALALAVTTPILDSVESPIENAKTTTPVAAPVVAAQPLILALRNMPRTSRSLARRSATRPATIALRAAQRSVQRETTKILAVRRAEQSRRAVVARAVAHRAVVQRSAAARRAAAARPTALKSGTAVKHSAVARQGSVGGTSMRMTSVIAFARAQVGKKYAHGGEGPNSFDCSGLTKRAYARAGLRLPHSSRAQAARARTISRKAARPGDLVVGPGHVGIYLGGGMMIDAGNPRTGVVFRRLYGGLHIERF
jgi:cell wall-associated NlpC family hydrolase